MIMHMGQSLEFFFYTVTLIQLFYYIFFFSRLAFFKPKSKSITQTHPVSLVICARDEAANLVKNIPGALAQVYATSHEVIVVNDNSVDETKYVLEAFYKKFKQLRIVSLTQEAKGITGKKFPLSMGIKTAKYEVLLLTDADCMPSSEFWLEKMQQGYDDNTEIVLGYGPLNKRKGLLNKLVRWETFHTALQYLSYARAGIPYMGVGRNLSYKKDVFLRHKGFSAHNNIPGGDDDLFINMAATKHNTNIVIDKDAFTFSDPPLNWSQWKRQKNRHYSTSKYYKPLFKLLLGLYSLSQFLFYPLFLLSLLLSAWKLVTIMFISKLIIQGIIIYRSMNKLNEKDLFPYFIFLDIWMFFYYIIFLFALLRKPAGNWK
ncbi:MAG: glycosyltransferase [Ginsengibacter sp.]